MHDDLAMARFAGLWLKAETVVRAYIAGALGVRAYDADDIVQQTCLSAVKAFGAYDSTRSFNAWMIGIARNTLMHYRRTRARDFHVFDDQLLLSLEGVLAEEASSAKDMATALEACLGTMQGRPRELVAAFYQRGESCRTIGEKMGMSENTVYGAIHRARQWLRSCVEKRLHLDPLPD